MAARAPLASLTGFNIVPTAECECGDGLQME
jgi:hypothetical protein